MNNPLRCEKAHDRKQDVMEDWTVRRSHPEDVRLERDRVIHLKGTGKVPLLGTDFRRTHPALLKNASYFPEIKNNLMSLQEIPKKRCSGCV